MMRRVTSLVMNDRSHFWTFLTLFSVLVFALGMNAQAKTLVISDSHGVGAFGAELSRLLEEGVGDSVSFFAFGGSKPIDWIEGNNLTWGYWEHHTGRMDIRGTNRNTPKLSELITSERPNRVIIVQGTNMVWHEQTNEDRNAVRSLIQTVAGAHAECAWVGPPDLRVTDPQSKKQIEQNHELLRTETAALGCTFIPSWTFTHYPDDLTGDGVHYDKIPLIGAELGRAWARGVVERISSTPSWKRIEKWNGRIERAGDGSSLNLEQLAHTLSDSGLIILGEKHDTAPIQHAQADLIRAVVTETGQIDFTTAWEFLNFSSQEQTREAYARFVSGGITVSEFLSLTGNPKYSNYAPILEATKSLGGQLLGVNLPRKDKDPVVQGGLGAALPGTIPPQFEMGGALYFERFKVAMDGHATAEQVQRYFEAQCLTDDVMAFHLLEDSRSPLKFLVVGSFHSDYFDGTIARIKRRSPMEKVAVVRFIDASDYTEAELLALLKDPRYGEIADFVFFVNEPMQGP